MAKGKKIIELLTLIDESSNSIETKSDSELNSIFIKFNNRKNSNLSKALSDLKLDINLYQLDHNYKCPKFLTRIVLDISQINSVNGGVGTASFLSNLWFGR